MAQIKLAKTAGFCWGVKRAIDITVEAAHGKNEPVYTYGPLIHNPQLISLLQSKNIHVQTDLDKLSAGEEVIIRTHGITPQKRDEIKAHGLAIKDATCPLVAKVQGMIRKYSRKGYSIIIVGDDHHAEVIGLKGYAETPVHVIASVEEVAALPAYEKVFVAAQTTCDIEKYSAITKLLSEKYSHIEIGDTICDATDERQSEVIRLSKEVDAMIVVGGKNSANTARLATIAKESGIQAYHIETADELDPNEISRYARIGVTAGASTPKWIIDEVMAKLAEMEDRQKPILYELLGLVVKSNLMLAGGGAALAYANMKVMGVIPSVPVMLLSFCAVLATYLTNQLLRPVEIQKSNIRKYQYHVKYNRLFWGIGLAALAAGLLISLQLGWGTALIYLAVFGFGATYGIDQGKLRLFGRLKNIPASKDIFVSLAWVMLVGVIPFINHPGATSLLFPALLTLGIAYTRSVLFDIRDIHADQVVGKEVMPILVGKEPAKKTLYWVLALLIGLCLLDIAVGVRGYLMISYMAGVGYLLGFVAYNENKPWAHSSKFDLFLDMPYFIIAAGIALLA